MNCPVCGRPTIQIKDGKEFYLPCLCAWERGFHDRLKRTIGSAYWTKTFADWDPPLFKQPCTFPDLMKIQKFVVVSRLWSFCFKEALLNEKKVPSLRHSIATNRNLFIRGPAGSGRGLLSSCIKMLAAMKDISTTELSCEFDIFKTDIIESSSYSKSGEEARLVVYRKYIDPELLVIENLRSENITKNSQFQKKFRGADNIDATLVKRQGKAGSILVTSQDFLGDIGDYYGNRLLEELSSDRTFMILLIHPKEADSIRQTLVQRHKLLISVLNNYDKSSEKKEKTRLDKQSLAEDMSLIEESLYFEDAFENIPVNNQEIASIQSIQDLFSTGSDQLPYERPIVEIYNRFEQNKKEQNSIYQRGIQQATLNAIKSCKELSSLMTERECLEIGKVISSACRRDKGRWEEIEKKASEMTANMSGRTVDNGS